MTIPAGFDRYMLEQELAVAKSESEFKKENQHERGKQNERKQDHKTFESQLLGRCSF